MTGMDAVEKQVEAFNARDLDAFVACYTRDWMPTAGCR